MVNQRTHALADEIIGAAQALELAAKRLKSDAKNIRQHGLFDVSGQGVDLMRMHKRSDVKRSAELALQQLGLKVYLHEGDPQP